MWPFEGNCEADVVPSENEFDTLALGSGKGKEADFL